MQHNVSIKIFNIKLASILSATQLNWPAKDLKSIICTFLNDNSLIEEFCYVVYDIICLIGETRIYYVLCTMNL